jgi:hypothetical protein
VTRCYRPKPGPFGWCGTVTDIRSTGQLHQKVKVRPDGGWGFCQRICSEQRDSASDDPSGVGRLRVKEASVLEQGHCEMQMLQDLRTELAVTDFKIRPHVLCVGFNHT